MDNALPVNMTDTIGGNNLENFQRSEFGLIMLKKYHLILSYSAHQAPNFTNPEFQFPQFKVLQSVVFFLFLI
jgi:hypothetical protein